jgi:hypothetical protein
MNMVYTMNKIKTIYKVYTMFFKIYYRLTYIPKMYRIQF